MSITPMSNTPGDYPPYGPWFQQPLALPLFNPNLQCVHCYCQPGPDINGVAHKTCCKCAERMAAPQQAPWTVNLILPPAMDRAHAQQLVRDLAPALNEPITRGQIHP